MAEVKARATLDSQPFKSGLSGMKREVDTFGRQMGRIKNVIAGAFSVGAITRLITTAIQAGSEITDFAYQTGLSVEAYQALDYAAKRAGASGEQVRVMFNKLKIAQGDVIAGNVEYAKYFKSLGIATKELIAMTPEQLFERMAVAITKSNNSAEAFSAAFKILGTRAGPALLEVLNEVADVGLQGIIDKGKAAAVIMDEEVAQAMDRAADAWEGFQTKITARTAETVAGIALIGEAFKEWLTNPEDMSFLDIFNRIDAGTLGEDLKKGIQSAVEESGGAIEDLAKTIETLRRQWGRLADQELESGMSTWELMERRGAQLDNINAQLQDQSLSTAEVLKLDIQRMEAQRDLNKLIEQNNAETVKGHEQEQKALEKIADARGKAADIMAGKGLGGATIQTDSLARIGGYGRGQPNEAARVAERQLAVAERMLEFMKRLPPDIATKIAQEIGPLGVLI